MTETDPNEKRQTYLEERKLLIDAEREAARSFDKAMITLSAGALGLSITFIRQLSPILPQARLLLYVAWGSFIFALLVMLLSFLFSQSAMRKQRDILDQEYAETATTKVKNNWATITNWLNRVSIGLFILGVIFLALFSIKNLPH